MPKHLMAIIVLATTLLSSPGVAMAACTTNTLFTPDGRVLFCTTCCVGTMCTTTCV